MNKKGFTLIELIGTIVILALILIIAIPAVNSISHVIKLQQRKNVIDGIEIDGARYAFDSGETIFFVEDLIMYGYADTEQNNIEDPVDNSSLNCNVIKAQKVGDYYKATFFENERYETDGKCDRDKLKESNAEVTISASNSIKDNEWIRLDSSIKEIKLTATIKNGANCSPFINNTANRCTWNSSGGRDVVGSNEITIPITENTIINSRYNFQITIFNPELRVISTSFALKIDNQKPEFSQKESKYDSANKTYRIIATDGMGSGIVGYYLGSTTSNCASATYQESNVINNVNTGNYKVCIKDKVGNILDTNVTI